MLTHPPQKAPSLNWHLGQLDALRGIAILLVMLVHSVYWGPEHIIHLRPDWLLAFAFAGQRGVQLFFLVSAFTLFLSNSNRRQESNPTLNFFIRRFFRLTPMLYLAVALTRLLWPAVLGSRHGAALSLVYLSWVAPSTISCGAAGAWSIATEAGFYMTLPFLFRWIKTPRRALVLAGIASAIGYIVNPALAIRSGDSEYWLFKSLPANYPTFMLGMCLYFLWQRYVQTNVKLDQEDRRTLSAFILFAFVVFYLYGLPFSAIKLTAESLILALLVLAVLLHPWPALVNRFTILVGKLSFSLYLLHFYVARFVERVLIHLGTRSHLASTAPFQVAAEYLLTLAITLPLAALTWTFLEKPGIRLGQRVIRYLEGRATASADLVPALSDPRDVPAAQV